MSLLFFAVPSMPLPPAKCIGRPKYEYLPLQNVDSKQNVNTAWERAGKLSYEGFAMILGIAGKKLIPGEASTSPK